MELGLSFIKIVFISQRTNKLPNDTNRNLTKTNPKVIHAEPIIGITFDKWKIELYKKNTYQCIKNIPKLYLAVTSRALFNFSLDNYWNMFISIACFVIGCVVGLVFISKLITKLTEKYPKTVYFTILGLLVASPFSIIYATCNEYTISFDFWTIFFSIISFATDSSISSGIGRNII